MLCLAAFTEPESTRVYVGGIGVTSCQDIVLAFGAVRLLDRVGFTTYSSFCLGFMAISLNAYRRFSGSM
jgi:hypothetical protein